ncbi:GNAT family N-acetyltransferase [Actinosynnema sp. NPDC050436]|uniref:GNAT family N-acetyltransferase n=1 Tax=Actinosynnema sp. NPDC050436 TaxID=3155659 RepID=UPI0033C71BA3
MTANIRIEPWSESDLDLLHRLNAPEMTTHLGGPEAEDQVVSRHGRYLVLRSGAMYRVVVDGESAGSVGFWEREWQGHTVHEVGWSVLPEFQGRGVAVAAAAVVVERARQAGPDRWVRAFPSVGHLASNAVCRKLGFTLQGEVECEYPPGRFMQCNDWGLAPVHA